MSESSSPVRSDRTTAATPPPDAGPRHTPVTLDAATLFGGRLEVRLLHRGQEYLLRVTKQGKLILTK